MIISHQHRFIFIKTAKTAGTSIEVFLSRHCGEDDVLTPVWPPEEFHRARNHAGRWNPLPEILQDGLRQAPAVLRQWAARKRFFNHIPARLLRHRVPRRVWDGYFKFCVERNPWDKTLSHFHMVRDRTGGSLTLERYLAQGRFCQNHPKYTDARGRLLVDRVLRYESLAADLAGVFGALGIPFDGDLGVRAKAEHRQDRRPYQEVYTPAQRQIVEAAFAREIALHGYVY